MPKTMRKTPDSDQARIDSLQRRMPDSVKRRGLGRDLDRVRERLVRDLGAIASKVESKLLKPEEGVSRAAPVMTLAYTAAARLAYASTGAPDWEQTEQQEAMIAVRLHDELSYFRGFMSDLAPESMKTGQRVSLYGGASDAAYWQAFISMLPSGSLIQWRLGIAEHCRGTIDCIRLAIEGPYTKPKTGSNPLPTVPKGGMTPCLGFCRCHLTSGAFALKNLIGAEILALGALAVDPTSDASRAGALPYQPMVEDYVYLRRMAYLESGSYVGMAASVAADIEAVAKSLNQTVRLTVNDAEILEPVVEAERRGFVHVTEPTQDLLGVLVSVLVSDHIDRGTISAVEDASITLDGERTYEIGRVGRGILFRE